MSVQGDYLIQDDADPFGRVPEMSRRARGVPVWAALRAPRPLRGRRDWSSGSAGTPARSPTAIATIDGAEVVNDVVFTQVCATFGDDDAHPGGGGPDAGRRHGVDERLAVAGPGGAAHLGEQRGHHRRGRGPHRRRRCAGRQADR